MPNQLRKESAAQISLLIKEMVKRVGKSRGRSSTTVATKGNKGKRINVGTFPLSAELFWALQAAGIGSIKLKSGRFVLAEQFVQLTGDPDCVKGKSAREDMTLKAPQVVSLGKSNILRFTTPREAVKTSSNKSVYTEKGSGSKGHKQTTKQPIKKRQRNK